MNFCIGCGAKTVPAFRFCTACGEVLVARAPENATPAEPVDAFAPTSPPAFSELPSAHLPEALPASIFDAPTEEPHPLSGTRDSTAFPAAAHAWGQPHGAHEAVAMNAGQGGVEAAIWRPDAVLAWGALFTPVFSAWLTAKNWRALGDDARAEQSMLWVYGFPVFCIAWMFFSYALETFISEPVLNWLGKFIGLAYLGAWAAADYRPQRNHVQTHLPSSFSRKSWVFPLSVAFGVYAVIALLVISALR